MKIKKIDASKNTINIVKRQLPEGENVFTNHVFEKRLISRNRELLKLNDKNQTIQWAKNLNRHIYKEDVQMPNSIWKNVHHHQWLGNCK